MSSDQTRRMLGARLSRRRWLVLCSALTGVMAAACAPAAPATAPKTDTKPTEPPKPAGSPAASPVAASSPAAAASPAAAGSPVAKPAASPSPSPSASPAAAASLPRPSAMTDVSQVMNWFAQSAHGGLFAALKNGDYEKVNLKMTNEQGGPQISAIPLVASGKHTFGMMQADQLLLARQEGIPIVGVFPIFQVNPQGLMYHQENPVKDFPDLNGRRVWVSPTATYWLYFVKKFNLDRVEQNNYNGQLAIFLNDKTAVFQCYVSSEPPAARKQGANPGYLLNADSGFNPYGNIMCCTEQTIKEKPEVVQAYVAASLVGWKSYLANPEPILPFIKEFNRDYDLELGALAAAAEKPLVLGKDNTDPNKIGTLSLDRLKQLHDQMREVGVLKNDVDFKAAIEPRFIEAAQRA